MCVQEGAEKDDDLYDHVCYNILLISNDVGLLSSIKIWLFTHFQMKDLREGSIFLGLKSYETERIEN